MAAKTSASKKTSAKKKATKKAAAKKAAAKKAPAKKKAAPKSTAKKAAAKKSSSARSAKAPAEKKAAKKPATDAAAAKSEKPRSGVSSLDVNMGHVFALRPRANTTFKPGDFQTAKHRLEPESYKNIHEAAAAVVELALELNHDNSRRGGGSGRRF